MFVRNSQLHDRAFKVRDSIAASANDATSTVRNVSNTLSNVDTTVSKYNIEGLNSSTLSSTVRNLNQQADSIDNTVDNNVNTINKLINGMYVSHPLKLQGIASSITESVLLLLVAHAVLVLTL